MTGSKYLWRICEIFSGFAFKSTDFQPSGIPIVKIGNLQNGTIRLNNNASYLPENKLNESLSKFVLKTDDLLIALTGATTGKIAVVPSTANGTLLNQRVGKVTLLDCKNAHLGYVGYFLLTRFFQNEIQEGILKSAQGNISPKQIGKIPILLPTLPEQKAI